jgi:HEAT repeat protein
MKNNRQKSLIACIALFVLFSFVSNASAKTADEKKSTAIVQTGDEKFDKTFREGRELIDKEEWKQAAEKFKSIVCDCPEKKYVDAAFYWLAFTYKKQKMHAEMNQALNRLQTNFPNSSWADDARVMQMEQPALIATTDDGTEVFIAQALSQATLAALSEKIPLDREEEIKLAAFRSLLASDADRAIKLTEDILKSDSKTSENLKIQIVRAATSRVTNTYSFGFSSGVETWTHSTNEGLTPSQKAAGFVISGNSGQFASSPTKNNNSLNNLTPKIREVLTKSYQNNSSVKVKKEIILAFGRLNDGESVNYLSRLYESESDKELKKAILQSFAGSGIYFRATTIANSTSSTNLRKANFERLLAIVKTEKDGELKAAALNNLQNMYAWARADEKNEFVPALLEIYDSSTDENFKIIVIRSLGQSNRTEAAKKLMEIARGDKSDKLRIAAIGALQGSKNPEVVKFLEDLIR